eukprot:7677857-Pyramimonas_sp.AAC.2
MGLHLQESGCQGLRMRVKVHGCMGLRMWVRMSGYAQRSTRRVQKGMQLYRPRCNQPAHYCN